MSAEQQAHSDELLDELFATMTAVGRVLAREHMLDADEDARLGVTRMLVLRAVADSGINRVGDMAHLLCIKPPAASSLLDSLEREGLVVREHSKEDKRVVQVRLTDEGHAALMAAEVERRRIMRERLAVLSGDDIRSLIRIQKTLMNAMLADGQ